MVHSERLLHAPPERVFGVLADAGAYGAWVVGTEAIRDADDTWPAVGSRFHHRIGIGPLKLDDHTEAVALEPGRRIELHAKVRPWGTAWVGITLEPRADGTATLVRMDEDAADPVARVLLFNPVGALLVKARNDVSLRRLEQVVARASR
jgi:uncharacterized protein YndB with AHSA1/START domain